MNTYEKNDLEVHPTPPLNGGSSIGRRWPHVPSPHNTPIFFFLFLKTLSIIKFVCACVWDRERGARLLKNLFYIKLWPRPYNSSVLDIKHFWIYKIVRLSLRICCLGFRKLRWCPATLAMDWDGICLLSPFWRMVSFWCYLSKIIDFCVLLGGLMCMTI